MTSAQLSQLSSPTDKAFHDAWGGVKVRLKNVAAMPQTMDGGTSLTDGKGHIILAGGSNLEIGDRMFYQAKAASVCHTSINYSSTSQAFSQIDGFSWMENCTWLVDVDNRCVDYNPASVDCAGNTCP
jgi:hypothetical protein